MLPSNLVNLFSVLITLLAFIVSLCQLRMTFRPNVFIRIHFFHDRTALEIVNAGTLTAEDICVKLNKEDINLIRTHIKNNNVKEQLQSLLELDSHHIQLLPTEKRFFLLYMQEDRGSFSDKNYYIHGTISYKAFLHRVKKNVKVEIGGIGSAIFEEWPKKLSSNENLN